MGPCDEQASYSQECLIGTLPKLFGCWPSSTASLFLRTGPLMEIHINGHSCVWLLPPHSSMSFISHLYPALVSVLFTERSLKASTHREEQEQLPASLSSGSIGQGLWSRGLSSMSSPR